MLPPEFENIEACWRGKFISELFVVAELDHERRWLLNSCLGTSSIFLLTTATAEEKEEIEEEEEEEEEVRDTWLILIWAIWELKVPMILSVLFPLQAFSCHLQWLQYEQKAHNRAFVRSRERWQTCFFPLFGTTSAVKRRPLSNYSLKHDKFAVPAGVAVP
jgi:hypothetical protein